MEIGSDSGARFLATFNSREAVVLEPNVCFQLQESSLLFSSFCPFPFLIYKISHLSSSSFGYITGTGRDFCFTVTWELFLTCLTSGFTVM